jgi:tetratricopeptide (TPR) repeat protein
MVSLWNRTRFSLSRIKMARLSAAKARVSQRTVYEQRSTWQRIASSWQLIVVIWNAVAKFVLQLAGILAFALIGVLLWKALTQKTIAIAPISVPKTVAENGYTADVAAQRLRDALNEVVERAHSRKNRPDVALQADLPSIVVPTVGVSLETIAADVRTFFHIPGRSNISGEFTVVQNRLRLRLRLNGQDIFTSPDGVDLERPNELLAPAAENIIELADPYIAAASLFKRDPRKCLEKARRIIVDNRETDQIPWAHNLVCVILLGQHNADDAIAECKKAIDLAPRLSVPHVSLGNALRDQHRFEEAIAEYRTAIALDPRYSIAHHGLGIALEHQGTTNEAIAEYRTAIDLDPLDAFIHTSLGFALRKVKTGEAIAEYQKAIDLDSLYALPHNGLGGALRSQGKTDEAIVEYRKAIELDPRDAEFHNNLGLALRDQDKTDEEAIAELRKAKELDPRNAAYHTIWALRSAVRAKPRRRSPSTGRPSSSILAMRCPTTA